MMQTVTFIEITAILAGLAGFGGFVIAWMALRQSKKTDNSADAERMGMLLTEIGYIKSMIDELRRKMEYSDERYTKLSERLALVEQATKTAHDRMDEYETRYKARMLSDGR